MGVKGVSPYKLICVANLQLAIIYMTDIISHIDI